MVLAYYIGLSMGWEKPQWAGLVVALCSLGTVGGSLRNGLLRINGTFLAGAVTLLLRALSMQGAIKVTDHAPQGGPPWVGYGGRYYVVNDTPLDRLSFMMFNVLFQSTVGKIENVGIPITISK